MRIILIEDQPDLAHWLARALTASGYVVDVIGDGIDADNALKTEEYDLAILDMNLPHWQERSIEPLLARRGLN